VPLRCCLDVGSTFTKGALVDVSTGELVASAASPTTIHGDVMDGVRDTVSRLAEAAPRVRGVERLPRLACSSAGGGLRLAVVGYERAVTAEAGYRVGLSAGAKVVHVGAGRLDEAGLGALSDATPDVVLLVGGTDGGNADVLLHNADRLVGWSPPVPVVVAGNAEVAAEVGARLAGDGRRAVTVARNVLPRIGVLDPMPARAAIREVFIRHVIGGKHLSSSPDFAAMVRAATPDAVLAGVELLADGAPGEPDVPGAGDVVVVDVGGATTDVYSVITPDPEQVELHREVVETMWRSRTVEGDLGVRWNALGVVEAARQELLVAADEAALLAPAAAARAADPDLLPADAAARAVDARLAELALTVALRRHARPQESGEVRTQGRDLRQVRLVVGSGGVLRHADHPALKAILAPALSDTAGGWKVPEHAALAVDGRYVLAAAGLLGADHPVAAARLATSALTTLPPAAPAP
jgi:uncharacterized protein (TIGR01319 family)